MVNATHSCVIDLVLITNVHKVRNSIMQLWTERKREKKSCLLVQRFNWIAFKFHIGKITERIFKIVFHFSNLINDIIFLVHDASAKIPSGLLSGNVNQFGDFDECLSVVAPNEEFTGKYCLSYVQVSVPDYLPQLRRFRKLIHSHDAFVNDFNDVSVTARASKSHKMLCFRKKIEKFTERFQI